MDWEAVAMGLEVVNRRNRAIKYLVEMTEAGFAYLRTMPEGESNIFWKQVQAALRGDLRYDFPVIKVDKLPD